MKTLALILALIGINNIANAQTIHSAKNKVEISRVVEVVTLVNKPGLLVNVAVQDLGGSTDVSPSQTIFLTLYSKGEIFSTDAAFEIDSVVAFKSARRISGGIYEIVALDEYGNDIAYRINAKKAVSEIQAIRCDGFEECDASDNFKSDIDVVKIQ